jgi:hypothetical protein
VVELLPLPPLKLETVMIVPIGALLALGPLGVK